MAPRKKGDIKSPNITKSCVTTRRCRKASKIPINNNTPVKKPLSNRTLLKKPLNIITVKVSSVPKTVNNEVLPDKNTQCTRSVETILKSTQKKIQRRSTRKNNNDAETPSEVNGEDVTPPCTPLNGREQSKVKMKPKKFVTENTAVKLNSQDKSKTNEENKLSSNNSLIMSNELNQSNVTTSLAPLNDNGKSKLNMRNGGRPKGKKNVTKETAVNQPVVTTSVTPLNFKGNEKLKLNTRSGRKKAEKYVTKETIVNQSVVTTSYTPLNINDKLELNVRRDRPKAKKYVSEETTIDLGNSNISVSNVENKLLSSNPPMKLKESEQELQVNDVEKKKHQLKEKTAIKRVIQKKQIKKGLMKTTKNNLESARMSKKTIMRTKKQQDIKVETSGVSNKRKRKIDTVNLQNTEKESNAKEGIIEKKRKIVINNDKKCNNKRQKIQTTKLNSALENHTIRQIEKAASLIEKRILDFNQSVQAVETPTFGSNEKVFNRSPIIEKEDIRRNNKTFVPSKKKGRKKKILDSNSGETFTSYKSSILSDTFSWTKEISSTSTSCVTVSSHDYVCIDGKIPIIKLQNCERNSPDTTTKTSECIESPMNNNTLLSETETESSNERKRCLLKAAVVSLSSNECTSHKANDSTSMLKTSPHILNLSTTTSSSPSTDVTSDTVLSKNRLVENYLQNIEPHCGRESLEREICQSKLTSIDLNFIRLKKDVPAVDLNKKHKKLLSFFNTEIHSIEECQAIVTNLPKKFLRDKAISQGESSYNSDSSSSNKDSTSAEDNINKDHNTSNTLRKNIEDNTHVFSENHERHKKSAEFSSYHYDDDDDALSLFAESIGTLDISRHNHSTLDEKKTVDKIKINYDIPSENPSQILQTPKAVQEKYELIKDTEDTCKYKNNKQTTNMKIKLICEKQNADSTSLNKDDRTNDTEHVHTNIDRVTVPKANNKSNEELASKNPVSDIDNTKRKLMHCYYSAKNITRTNVFGGVCFFYLSAICKKRPNTCYFKHSELDSTLVKYRLEQQDNRSFIEEYMLARKFSKLRYKFMNLFIENCVKRNLPRVLMEMAIDSAQKDSVITRIPYLETILLAFNELDIDVCRDLLFYKVTSSDELCDILLHTIVFSQNFFRFVRVFIKLINAKIENHRRVDLTVATQTLERISILPYNESLTKTFFKILSHTDYEIFNHSMMTRFENMLSKVNGHIYEEFLHKKAVSYPTDSASKEDTPTPAQPSVNLIINAPLMQDVTDNKIRTSPDTTLLDSMNKTNEELPAHRNKSMPVQANIFSSDRWCKSKEPLIKTPKFIVQNRMYENKFDSVIPKMDTSHKQILHGRPANARQHLNWYPGTNASCTNPRYEKTNLEGIHRRQP